MSGARRPTFVFRVRGGGTVRFVVRQLAPVCRGIGSFTVRTSAGVNRLRFSGRVRGHRLRSGTYVIRARHGRAVVFEKTLVVGDGSPTANACAPAAAPGGGSSGGGTASGGSEQRADGKAGGVAAATANPRSSGVLGARASKILPDDPGTQLGLLIVLASAIFLLGIGALPREVVPHPAAAAFLARRRALVAVAGFGALGAFLVSYFFA